jgi:hypothetical protein
MIKKLLFFFAAFMLTSVVQAQNETQEHWWGYVSDDTERIGLGVSAVDNYHCAIFIPGNHYIASGKTIKAVRFGLTAPNAKNTKVWLASELPDEITEASTLQIINVTSTGSDINVELTTPYTIPANGVYVGYSFSITKASTEEDMYPVYTTGSDNPNALLLKTERNLPDWQDLNGNNFGSLFLQVLLEGEFLDNNATPADFDPVYTLLGQLGKGKVAVKNDGGTSISSIDYTITTDGVTSEEYHADVEKPIAFNATGIITVTIPSDSVTGTSEKTLNITKVNGNANIKADKAARFSLVTLPELVERNVVVEERTGTGCGWCPRGLVGMEKLRKTYGDRFVGIGLHQYNSSDAMYIAASSYARLGMNSAPSCKINRGEIIDPYYGADYDILDDFADQMSIPAVAKVSVSGIVDSLMTKVEATAEVEALLDNSKFTLEFVVIGDSLQGTSTAWNQANYYYQYAASQLPEDLAIFGRGGKYGQSSIKGYYFNDVALCSSYVNGVNKAPAIDSLVVGVKKEAKYTLTLPTTTTLKNAMKLDQLYVIALLVDKNKMIVNAAKTKIELEKPEVIEPDTTEVIPESWTDLIVNGNMEGESMECFYVTEQGVGGPFVAVATDSIGVNGSKAVKVQSADNPVNDWDSQFFIRLPYQLPAGTKYKVSFDYKADKAGDFDTQAHSEPGQYIHWAMIGSGSFTNEWQTYTAEGTVPAECDGSDHVENDVVLYKNIFQTIAFNLGKNKVESEFVFDNVKFEIPTAVAETLTPNPAADPKPYPTGIENVSREVITDNGWYTLDGRKVTSRLKKGIYVKNGKKAVVK